MTKKKQEHRLYLHIAEPVKFLGMTTFELVLGFVGFGGFMIHSGHIYGRLLWLIGGWGGIIAIRQVKNNKLGNNLRPYLVYFGLIPGPSVHWIPFDQRILIA